MLGTLLNHIIICLVAMNQSVKAVVFIVYRFSGSHVKLFRQIALSVVEILIFQRVAPLFLGNAVQTVVGVADLCAITVGHGAEVAVLRAVIIAGQLSAAYRDAGHIAEAVVAHVVILGQLRAARRNETAAPHCNQVAAGVFVASGDYFVDIIRFGTATFSKIAMVVGCPLGIRLGAYGALGIIGVCCRTSTGVRLAGHLGAVVRIRRRSDNLSGRRIAVGGQGGCSAVSIVVIGDVHGNVVVGNLRDQMVVVAVFVFVGISTVCFGLRLGQLISR